MTLPVALTTEIQKLAPSAVIELFILDATSLGGDVLRFHAGTNALTQNVVWQGHTYVRFPIHVSGFEINGQGQFPRPKLQVSNALSAITAVILQFNDLLGAKLTRKRTMAKFLDAVNFSGSVNPTEDQTAEFQEDVYFIDRKSSEDLETVQFELSASVDLVGVSLPRRQVIQNVCIWKYRGAECGFAGPPLRDKNDNKITTASTPEGVAMLAAIEAYNSAVATLATREATLTSASQAKGPACDIVFQGTFYNRDPFALLPTDGVRIDLNGNVIAMRSGGTVTLGVSYRVGAYVETMSNGFYEYHRIETYGVNTSSCTSATTAYNTALAARDAAAAALVTATTNRDLAVAALPLNDPLYALDRCGKRLSSCKARFGETAELPFGSFPASGLSR